MIRNSRGVTFDVTFYSVEPRLTLRDTHKLLKVMELARGIEPPTCGLQNRCSAIELRQPARNITHLASDVNRRGGECAQIVPDESACGVLNVGLAHDRIPPIDAFRFVS